jgi:rhamnosyltransferase
VIHGVLAVVPTFHPDRDDLVHLVTTLTAQSVPTLVVDDASPCTYDPVLEAAREAGARVVQYRSNEGIARGLNAGLHAADGAGARWLLTVDQDSKLSPDYIERILLAADFASSELGPQKVGAVAAGSIDDASGELTYPAGFDGTVVITQEVIQTGTLWDVQALTAIGGFDETLGIDAVDAAACLRVRQTGRRIVLATDLGIQHQVGEGRQVSILGRPVLASGHAPHRRTTMIRNRLRLFPAEFALDPVHALRTLRRIAVNTALAVTIEDDRWEKAKASARGIFPASKR